MNAFSRGVALVAWIAVAGSTWSPGREQVAEAQAGLEGQVRRAAAEQHLSLTDWPSYSFQYQGQVQAGQRIIFINAFCTPAPSAGPRRRQLLFPDRVCAVGKALPAGRFQRGSLMRGKTADFADRAGAAS